MTGSRILVVEDDQTLLDILKYNIAREGYDVLTASDGLQALEAARSSKPEVIVLDIMLPRLDGLEVCRILRKEMMVPIIMLTARTEEIDKIVGLETGADDYMTKPFGIRELLARIRAMLRRAEMMKQEIASAQETGSYSVITAGNLNIDQARHQVSLNDSILDLSPLEFDLLTFLASNRGRVFSRDYLLQKVWGYDFAGDTRTVDVHIRWLRQKIEADPANPVYLITVRGVGYKFEG